MFTSLFLLAAEANGVVALRMMKLMRGGNGARREAELMVREKMDAALEATASLMTGVSGDRIVHRYRKRVAANAKRLIRLNSGRSQKRKLRRNSLRRIRETIRSLDKVALARVVLTNREHVIALEALDKGLMGMLLRYPYEVRDAAEYFDEIQDVKITKDMLELAKHIVEQRSGHFEPDKFEDHYESALAELLAKKQKGLPTASAKKQRRATSST